MGHEYRKVRETILAQADMEAVWLDVVGHANDWEAEAGG